MAVAPLHPQPPLLPLLPLLRLRGIRKAFGAAQALRGADLEIAAGEVHALVGENGAGKSTLMAILGGSLAPDEGVLEFLGRAYRPASPREAGNLGVALVHQELALAPHLDLEANITLGRERSRFGFLRGQSARVREILARLGYGHLDPRARMDSLGVAERQIAEIARALFLDARLILMDEPTSSLPARDTEKLFEVIGKLKATGVSVIYISHFLDEVRRVADRITVLRDGETVAAGLPAATPQGDILQAMVGRPIAEIFPRSALHPVPGPAPESAPVLLRVRDWVARPGASPVTLELRRGQILGIAGLVGSGRSSLLRSLYGINTGGINTGLRSGLRPAHSGSLETEARLGFVSEDRKEEGLALNLSIRANATLGHLRAYRGRSGLLRLGAEGAAVSMLCEDLRIRHQSVDQAVGTLSGGNQQKVALGRLLLGDADIWLLDEPTRGVDMGAKAEIYRLITQYAERGKAILWAGSYLPELFGVCDSLAVMHRGRLSAVLPVSAWTEAAVMAWATSGVS